MSNLFQMKKKLINLVTIIYNIIHP